MPTLFILLYYSVLFDEKPIAPLYAVLVKHETGLFENDMFLSTSEHASTICFASQK